MDWYFDNVSSLIQSVIETDNREPKVVCGRLNTVSKKLTAWLDEEEREPKPTSYESRESNRPSQLQEQVDALSSCTLRR